ncbi:hypothetical protein ECG_09540 [Echinococcus granulosus]|nr:hypothetical protein ECG_09540 [Echinococcus granulosus]
MEEVEHPSPRVKQNEPPKKKMPLITTYNSDEEEDDIDDFEAIMPPSEMRADIAPFPACDVGVIDLTNESTPPPSSDSSSDTDEPNEKKEEKANVAALMSKFGHMSLLKLLNSSTLQQLRRAHSSSVFEEKEKLPRSFVIFFHETLCAASSHSPPTTAMIQRSFGETVEDAMAQWKRLSPEERRVYRKRALHSKASYTQHLLDHRAKLRTVASQNTPRCTNPPCQQAVVFDSRWNLNYCSAASPLSVTVTTVTDAVKVDPNGGPPAEKESPSNPMDSSERNPVKPTESLTVEVGAGDQDRFRGNLFDRIQNQPLASSNRSTGDIQPQKDCS